MALSKATEALHLEVKAFPALTPRMCSGTAEFLSMEMVNRLPYGRPTDVWAIGVIVFMLICGDLTSASHLPRNGLYNPHLMAGRFPFDDPDRATNIDDLSKAPACPLQTTLDNVFAGCSEHSNH